jgi:hypothetical protein
MAITVRGIMQGMSTPRGRCSGRHCAAWLPVVRRRTLDVHRPLTQPEVDQLKAEWVRRGRPYIIERKAPR